MDLAALVVDKSPGWASMAGVFFVTQATFWLGNWWGYRQWRKKNEGLVAIKDFYKGELEFMREQTTLLAKRLINAEAVSQPLQNKIVNDSIKQYNDALKAHTEKLKEEPH